MDDINKRQNYQNNSSDAEQQALLILQQMGLPVISLQSILQNQVNKSQEHLQSDDLVKAFLKTLTHTCFDESQRRSERELTHKRRSLIQDFGASEAQDTSNQKDFQKNVYMRQSPNDIGLTSSLESSYLNDEEENLKKKLNEKLEKIDRERTQAVTLQKNAEKKAKACERLLTKASQEPSFLIGIDENDDNDAEREGQSSSEALIERIYAENKKKAASAAVSIPIPCQPGLTVSQQITEDMIRITKEYEAGMKILPFLVQAMRIQRERRQDALEHRKIIYDEKLAIWDKKVVTHEKNQKKITRDAKNREIFEKTFNELKKIREEKERTSRIDRSRLSLMQEVNGTSAQTIYTMNNIQLSQLEDMIETDMSEIKVEELDDKIYTSVIIPPFFTNLPRRFFENCNGLQENSLTEIRAQLEIFQNAWSDTEKAVFSEKISAYGKNFAAIAAFIPTKTVKECVQFYYMTKKKNNYKQKFGKRRKKICRQGYRPPIMPRFGDSDENLQNYRKDCTFVECLLCNSRILVLESLTHQSYEYDDFNQNIQQSNRIEQQPMPICTKCQSQAQRNKTLNKCPLGSCVCSGGKRKMRPARNIPEKFSTLDTDQKRFLICRLKMPPSAQKCCTSCFKRITKDIDELLNGDLQTEFERLMAKSDFLKRESKIERISNERIKHDDDEEIVDFKIATKTDKITSERIMEFQPSSKEIKLEKMTNKVEIKNDFECDGTDVSRLESMFSPNGSITKGIPNRTRSSLIESINETVQQMSQSNIHPTCSVNFDEKQETIKTTGSVHQLTFNKVENELSEMIESTYSSLNKHQSQHRLKNNELNVNNDLSSILEHKLAENDNLDILENQQNHRNFDTLRRKSGLATALLPAPESPSIGGVNKLIALRNVISPNDDDTNHLMAINLSNKDKSLIEQWNSNINITTNLMDNTKADAEIGQLSNCYESLSDDSDKEEITTFDESERAIVKIQTPTDITTTNFYSIFDLAEEQSISSHQSLTVDLTKSTQQTANPHPQISNYFGNLTSSNTITQGNIGCIEEKHSSSVYEPLSSDEET